MLTTAVVCCADVALRPGEDHAVDAEGESERLPRGSEEDAGAERQMGQKLARTGTDWHWLVVETINLKTVANEAINASNQAQNIDH